MAYRCRLARVIRLNRAYLDTLRGRAPLRASVGFGPSVLDRRGRPQSSRPAAAASRLEEWEFLTAVVEEADCAILLDFPATLAVVGTDNFAAIVKEYLLEHPPTEPSILYASLYLADFLNVHPFAERWPFIAELARLERAVLDVFHAADAPALSLEALRAIPSEKWPAVKLRAHPAVEIVHSEWRIADGLHTVEQGQGWSDPEHEEASVLVWRQKCVGALPQP
jgi:hypothetical protein